jgi:hypothetical protein
LGEAGDDVLRSLENKVPTEVGEDDNIMLRWDRHETPCFIS